MSFENVNQMKRVAKYWDLIANSGRFQNTLALFLGNNAFAEIWDFSDWLYQRIQQTHSIALDRLFALVFEYLTEVKKHDIETIQKLMQQDFIRFGMHGWPKFLGALPDDWKKLKKNQKNEQTHQLKRQQQHQ